MTAASVSSDGHDDGPARPGSSEVVWVAWRDCNCDWITKTCDELHLRGAQVPRVALEALAARADEIDPA